MGGNQSINRLKEVAEHPRLGRYVMSHKEGTTLMGVDIQFSSQHSINAWIDNVRNLDNCRQSLFLPESHNFVQTGFCGGAGLLKVQFELFPYTLAEEIKNRYGLGCKFSEQELWYLLYQTCLASSHFERRGTKSGDIRPQNILISPEGTIKVFNRITLPDEETNYQKALEQREPTYLAPEEFRDLQKGAIESVSNPIIAEAFSVGLTVLDAALMQDASSLYNMNSPSFRKLSFREMIASCKKSLYSEFFTKTLLNLLQYDPKDRPTAGQVWAMLRPYEAQIINLKQFTPNKQNSRKSVQAYQAQIKQLNAQLNAFKVSSRQF